MSKCHCDEVCTWVTARTSLTLLCFAFPSLLSAVLLLARSSPWSFYLNNSGASTAPTVPPNAGLLVPTEQYDIELIQPADVYSQIKPLPPSVDGHGDDSVPQKIESVKLLRREITRGYFITYTWLYKDCQPVTAVKDSLSMILQRYRILAGRYNPTRNGEEVLLTDEGVSFRLSTVDWTMSEYAGGEVGIERR